MRQISDRSIVRSARAVAALGIAMAVGGSAILIATDHVDYWSRVGGHFVTALTVFFGILVWVVIVRQPRNKAVWAMLAPAFFFGWYLAGATAAAMLVDADLIQILPPTEPSVSPADLPTGAALVLAVTYMAWAPAIFTLMTVGLLLFPDGKPPSPRWRWLVVLSMVMIPVVTVFESWRLRPGSTTAYDGNIAESPFDLFLLLGAVATAFVSVAAVFIRFRTSRGESRQQLKWIAWGASVFMVSFGVVAVLEGSSYQSVGDAIYFAGGGALLLAYGIAVAKYRLYDVDVVISKTFVYGMLAVFITAVYVGSVVVVGGMVGGDEPGPWLAIGATALVAIAFEPLRQRLQRVANRMVYGRRATPYEVLSDFSRNIATSDEELLTQIARSLVEGTTASSATIWVGHDGNATSAAVWPPEEPTSATIDLTKPVVHDGEELGAVALTVDRGQTLLPTDEHLLDQVVSGMGLALRNISLRQDLRRHVDELGDSRQRLVTAQDETRRRLERELNEGAQRHLSDIKAEAASLREDAESYQLRDVATLLERAIVDTDHAIEVIGDFAGGAYPPLLEADGVADALGARIRGLPIPVTLHAAGVGRHDHAVEATVYFCVLEALQNVVKHAGASSAYVVVRDGAEDIRFEVSDDGIGFDPERVDSGSGLVNLADRVDILGGRLEIESAPGAGTTVRGAIPIRVLEGAT